MERALGVLSTHGVVEDDADGDHYRIAGTMFRDWFDSHVPVAEEVSEILDQLKEQIDRLISGRNRRDTKELLAQMREVLGGRGDPREIRRKGSGILGRIWEVVKGVKDAAALADIAVRLVPHLGTAAVWILRQLRS